MAKRGPKPTPTVLRLVKNNPGKRRINRNEPKPLKDVPLPHEVIIGDPVAVREWNRQAKALAAVGLLTEFDKGALASYCMIYSTWFNAEKRFREYREQTDKKDLIEGGYLIKGSASLMIHPLLKIAREARSDYLKVCAEFGMTPSSRGRLTFDPAKTGSKNSKEDEDLGFGA